MKRILSAGTGKKQKAAAEEAAAAKDASKNEVLLHFRYAVNATPLKPNLQLVLRWLQQALEGEGTASTNEDAEEAKEPAQKKGKKKTTKASAS